jgi:hypothetical protein
MENKLKHYFSYPLYQGNIATILAPAILFSLMVFIAEKISGLIGPYGAVPGLLLAVAVVCFSLDYLRQIVKSSTNGETEAPEWKVDRVDIEELFRGVIPIAVTLFEVLFFVLPVNFSISLYMKTGFIRQFINYWKLLIFVPFVILYPINLLSYSVFDDFIIIRLFRNLSRNSLLKIFTVYTLSFAALIYIILLPIWRNFFLNLMAFALIFYLFQIGAYALGRMYYKNVDFLVEG